MSDMNYRSWIKERLEIGKEIIYLTREDARNMGVTNQKIIDLTEKSMISYSKKISEMPAKIGIHPYKNTFFHAMPADLPEQSASGMKWISCFPENQNKFGIPQTVGLLVYNDRLTGMPLGVMDCVWITEKRTPAAAAVSAKHLANKNADTFGMIGCGVQGRAHVEIIELVMPNLKTIYIYDIFESAMDKLIKEVQPKVKAKIVKTKSFEEIVKSAEVIASATIITEQPEPKIKDEWISKGQTLLLSDAHSLYEDQTMKRADKYILDSIEQHELLLGHGYYPHGLPKIYAETGEVAAGLKKARENKDEFIVVNNIGMAVEDIIVAKEIFDKALIEGKGIRLPL
ncbi:ornithine cyclodeaminase family protein [Maledivibacter halophilus]|uniref:Ornithine cyclodeaminase n=1 Tax=Maledivibacter halophilus TaxID=36842 RepID=A0A1T5IA91_9FIRM|nr:ornithine cyclodeaminase family protein [Maledivibacter halophilus]SKC35852.1 ornithine cyclodeaminase [Maledivibacter halophilus]